MRTIKLPAIAVGLALFLSGCASVPATPPTAGEMASAQSRKETMAVVEFLSERFSEEGIGAVAQERLAPFLQRRFDLVEDRHAADYLLYGSAGGSSYPERKSESYERDGKEFKRSWTENSVTATVSIRIVSAATGETLYRNAESGQNSNTSDEEDEGKKKSKVARVFENIGAAGGFLSTIAGEWEEGVSEALDEALRKAREDLKTHFPLKGEVLQIVSDHEILVNLGSAMGVEPGDLLKAGRLSLRAGRTSGLTLAAKGSKRTVASLQVGDPVEATY